MASFQPSKTFIGAKEGMEFKLGQEGLGYYQSSHKSVELKQAPLQFEEPRKFVVGMRVQDEDQYFATVKYVGNVTTKKKKATPSLYIGVEWDEPSRGKHDGTFEGVEYFKTTYPGAGSFMKPSKLVRGITFTEALNDAEYPPSTNVHAILKSMKVDRAGDASPQPQENQIAFINLEDNLLSTFDDAFLIASRCPELEILRLGKNFFLPKPLSDNIPKLENLHSLTLTMCRLSNFDIIEKLSSYVPNLTELSLAGNPDLLLNQMPGSSMESKQGNVIFQNIKVLEMSNTGIDKWAQCEALLVACPLLSTLNLTRNKLKTLSSSSSDNAKSDNNIDASSSSSSSSIDQESGLNLMELTLDGNLVEKWNELHHINKRFPSLKSFGFVQNPCASGLDRRRLDRAVVPIMSNIIQLDSKPITPEARVDIEQQFLIAALRSSVAKAVKLRVEESSGDAPTASIVEETATVATGGVGGGDIVGNDDDSLGLRIPPLEEFVELPGAKVAMDKILTESFPHFFLLAEKHGNPPAYDRLLQLE